MKFIIAWILSLFLAFTAGIVFPRNFANDEELKQKVNDHLDIIVDEAAAIVDDVTEAADVKKEELKKEIEETDEYKEAKEFAENVKEVAGNTAADIDEHFGTNLTGEEDETETEETAPDSEKPAKED